MSLGEPLSQSATGVLYSFHIASLGNTTAAKRNHCHIKHIYDLREHDAEVQVKAVLTLLVHAPSSITFLQAPLPLPEPCNTSPLQPQTNLG